MQYLLLIYGPESQWAAQSEPEKQKSISDIEI